MYLRNLPHWKSIKQGLTKVHNLLFGSCYKQNIVQPDPGNLSPDCQHYRALLPWRNSPSRFRANILYLKRCGKIFLLFLKNVNIDEKRMNITWFVFVLESVSFITPSAPDCMKNLNHWCLYRYLGPRRRIFQSSLITWHPSNGQQL